MPRFYFHLCHCNECIRDDMGCDLPDVSTARTKAEKLARRVMTFSSLATHEPDWRHWTVTVTNERQEPTLSIMFGAVIDDLATNYAALPNSVGRR